MNKISYKKWAFRFTIWILIINLVTFFVAFYLTVSYEDFPGVENNSGLNLVYLEILSSIILLLSVIFIIISSVKKERRNYQFWISIIGIMLFGILPLIASFI
jgi:heme/copper-type cytochrome/quinol oxidase subunit 3